MDIQQEKLFFNKLKRLFSASSVVRQVGKKKLVVKDLDSRQITGKKSFDKYSRIRSTG